MPIKKTAEKSEPKQYFQNVPRRWAYGGLGVFALIAIALFLAVPHYKPLKLITSSEMNQAHHDIIKQYFVDATTCPQDNQDESTQIRDFNAYFKVNKYGNRAVLHTCRGDQMLAKDDTGKWVTTDVNIVLSSRQNPVWQKACLIDDITTADTKVRPENASIDANNFKLCDSLSKQSYLQKWFE